MVYLLKMVIFHGELLNNQRVIIYRAFVKIKKTYIPKPKTWHSSKSFQRPLESKPAGLVQLEPAVWERLEEASWVRENSN